MKGSITNKLEVIGEVISAYGCEKFGAIEIKSKEQKQMKGRREMEIETLKHRLKLLRGKIS